MNYFSSSALAIAENNPLVPLANWTSQRLMPEPPDAEEEIKNQEGNFKGHCCLKTVGDYLKI